jgi:Kef-type K+ transport system membrane component KefB
MTSAAPRGPVSWFSHLVLLLAFGALVVYATRIVHEEQGRLWTIAAIGFLLLAGTLMSELVAPIGLPHLTGYLAAGIVAGPHVLGIVDAHTVKNLSPVNVLALSLIALAGGAELELASVRAWARSLAFAMAAQTLLVFAATTGAFLAVRPLIPFLHDFGFRQAFGVALCWGVLAVSRSPSATLGILAQTRATGVLANYTLAFVMASDVLVVMLMAAALGIARPLVDPSLHFALDSLVSLVHELFGSVAIGTTLGLVIAAYLRLVNRQMLVVLLALGFGASAVLEYLRFDALLSFMVAGFVVRNLSRQGQRFLHGIEQAGAVVYVIFFAIAGADLDLPLLRALWPVALVFAGVRGIATVIAARAASVAAGDPPRLRTWSWSGLVSQAGLTIGLSLVIAREFPGFGAEFRSLAIATVAVNELFGPIFFKFALDRAGETAGGQPSMPPAPLAPSETS